MASPLTLPAEHGTTSRRPSARAVPGDPAGAAHVRTTAHRLAAAVAAATDRPDPAGLGVLEEILAEMELAVPGRRATMRGMTRPVLLARGFAVLHRRVLTTLTTASADDLERLSTLLDHALERLEAAR